MFRLATRGPARKVLCRGLHSTPYVPNIPEAIELHAISKASLSNALVCDLTYGFPEHLLHPGNVMEDEYAWASCVSTPEYDEINRQTGEGLWQYRFHMLAEHDASVRERYMRHLINVRRRKMRLAA